MKPREPTLRQQPAEFSADSLQEPALSLNRRGWRALPRLVAAGPRESTAANPSRGAIVAGEMSANRGTGRGKASGRVSDHLQRTAWRPPACAPVPAATRPPGGWRVLRFSPPADSGNSGPT